MAKQYNSLSVNAVNWGRSLACLTMLLGITVLVGWALNITALKSILPGLVSMKVNTAVGLFLGGLVLFLQTFQTCNYVVLGLRRLSIGLILLIGIVTLCEYLFAWNVGIDQLLFSDSKTSVLSPFSARMSLLTAGYFALLGSVFLLTELNRHWYVIQALAFITIVVVLLPLAGYLYGNLSFPRLEMASQMAAHTALGGLLLSSGLLIITSVVGFPVQMQKKLPILGIVTALIMVIFVAGGVLSNILQNRAAARWVEHTYSVNLHLEKAVSSLHSYQANMRAYFINHDKFYYLKTQQAHQQFLSELNTVKKLTSDNLSQQQINAFFPMLEQYFAVANERINNHDKQEPDSLIDLEMSGKNNQLSSQITEKLKEIKQTEFTLLTKREQDAKVKNAVSIIVTGFFILLGLGLMIMTFCALLRKIKQHVAGEKLLHEKEERLRVLFNANENAIIVIDERGLIEEFNPESETIFNYSHDEVIGKNISTLMPEFYASKHDSYLKNYLAGGKPKIIGSGREVIGKRKNGELFPMQLHVGEVKLDNSRLFIGFVNELTKLKQAERISRQFEAIVQSSNDAIVSKDLEGTVTSWNFGAKNVFGYTAEETVGQTLEKLFPTEYRDEEQQNLQEVLQTREGKQFESVRLHKDGTRLDVAVTLSPIFDSNLEVVGLSKIIRDISDRKKMEAELIAAKQNAEAGNRSKSEFLANMSHEIRTPMNAVLGLTRLALETEMTDKQRDYLTKVQSSSQALLIILNDILDLSKIESGHLEIEDIEFNPTDMLQSVVDLFAATLEEKNLELFLDIATDVPLTIMGDPLRIQQVLSNLVSNAIKFTPNGMIYIRMGLEESNGDDLQLRLSVRDTGIGIKETTLKQLFHPFTQADNSITRKFGGTGLGLTITKQLVELMEGEIAVSSELGMGSTFSFTIHCTKGQSYHWMEDSQCIKNTRVLIVDDQQTSCAILKNILESWELEAETVSSAKEALQKIKAAEGAKNPFDLLLLDWKLKNTTGLALVRELRERKAKVQPAIIMVTAHKKEKLLDEMNKTSTHIETILTKPVVPSSLLDTILHVYHYKIKHDKAVPKIQADPYELARTLHNSRILLVEDNAVNQQVAGEFLEKVGLRISIANHGGEAVEWVKKKEFDAILMDLQMPEMDGYEATKEIRRLANGRDIPIIAMTAAAMQNDKELCLSVGMNDHIAKPIQPLVVIKTLLRWLNPASTEAVLTHSPITKTNNDLADKLPGFELEDIMIMLSNDEEKLLRLLIAFKQEFSPEVSEITKKISEGDLKEAEKSLHMLKGSAGNLGAKELYQASAELDAQLIEGIYDAKTLSDWLEAFTKTAEIIDKLKIMQPELDSPENLVARQQVIAELDSLLANDDFINDDLLERLKSCIADNQQKQYNHLVQLIINTDYDKARILLSELQSKRIDS